MDYRYISASLLDYAYNAHILGFPSTLAYHFYPALYPKGYRSFGSTFRLAANSAAAGDRQLRFR